MVDFSQLDTENDLALINEDGSILLPFEVTNQSGEKSEIPGELNNFSLQKKRRRGELASHKEGETLWDDGPGYDKWKEI